MSSSNCYWSVITTGLVINKLEIFFFQLSLQSAKTKISLTSMLQSGETILMTSKSPFLVNKIFSITTKQWTNSHTSKMQSHCRRWRFAVIVDSRSRSRIFLALVDLSLFALLSHAPHAFLQPTSETAQTVENLIDWFVFPGWVFACISVYIQYYSLQWISFLFPV